MNSSNKSLVADLNVYDLGGFLEVQTGHFGGLKGTNHLLDLIHLEEKSNFRILEVGCGTGTTSCLIAKRYNVNVTGMDISEYMINTAQKKAQKQGLSNVKFIIGSVYDIPFEENYFNCIIAESITAIVPDKHKVLQEYFRVLKPGGIIADLDLFLVEGTPERIISKLHELLKFVLQGEVFIYTINSWKTLFMENSFNIIETKEYRDSLLDFKSFKSLRKSLGTLKLIKLIFKLGYLAIKNKPLRQFLKKIRNVQKDVFKKIGNQYEYLGYFTLIGEKPIPK